MLCSEHGGSVLTARRQDRGHERNPRTKEGAPTLFLASPMASFVTGSALFPDGGYAAVK